MIETDKLEEYGKMHNYDLTQEFDQLTLIREKGRHDPELLKLIKPQEKAGGSKTSGQRLEDNTKLPNQHSKGVKSSVGIAAAITAYARISLNRFKNIPDNKYLGGDTDSAIMQNRLPNDFVGPELGMMKFEDDIHLGLYADKKLYYAINSQGKENIKSRGVGKDFNKKDILKLPHFLLMLAGKVVRVNKTKFVITKKGSVEIKNVNLDTKIQKLSYKEVVTEIKGYLSNQHHPKHHIARYISWLSKLSDNEINNYLNTNNKALLKLLEVNVDMTCKSHNTKFNLYKGDKKKESLDLTIYNSKGNKLIVYNKGYRKYIKSIRYKIRPQSLYR